MKFAVYVDNGRRQLVFTPESEFEKRMIKELGSENESYHIRFGEFYECQGGWTRHGSQETSLIMVRDIPNEAS